jgi:alkylation response protein AidB-like acyl-CoA dehydrogenase
VDFSLTDDQQAIADLAKQIFADLSTNERQRALEQSGGPRFDRELWKKLAEAGLLATAVPEDQGGAGLGFLEVAAILEQIGRHAAPVPLYETLVLGALPLAEFGTAAQQKVWLPGVAAGTTILTAALTEDAHDDPARPHTAAQRDGAGWILNGAKIVVPAGDVAARIIVPAATGGHDVGVFLVDPKAAGVTLERQVLTNGEPHARLALKNVHVPTADVIGDPTKGAAIVQWIVERATAAYCAMQVGVCDRALRMTAAYTTERKQFDRAIATFQAVQQRAADAFIDLDCIRMATWEAIYRLANGLDATEMVRIAKYFASDAGQRVVVAAQHLHGGIGVDVDYPLHRYFIWGKHIELILGPAPAQLAKMGAELAA